MKHVLLTILISITTLSVSAQQPLKFNVIVQRKSAAVDVTPRAITNGTTPAADTTSELLKSREGVINDRGGPRLKDKEYYLCFYSASWCALCHQFQDSEEYKRIDAAYWITIVDWDKAPKEWKEKVVDTDGKHRIPALQLRRISDRKLVRLWIGATTLQQIDDARLTPPANPIPVNNGVTQREMILIHDRIHNQASGMNATWTWSGNLRDHLRTVHGVAL